ncbi:MAG: MFS transporter [Saprospiraceae bacterium]|nr:MFS transporter [Saprospiraceae bacterium]
MNFKSPPFRGALVSSGVMAFSGLGDAILYPILPIYGKELGFSAFWIGMFLSVNRFVRILSNTAMANAIGKLGMKRVLTITAAVAVMTTAVYGLKIGLIGFLFARVLWGLSYSGLKIATLNYAAMVKKNTAVVFGAAQSIQSLGAVFALLIGPWILQSLGIQNGFILLAIISSGAILFTLLLPEMKTRGQSVLNRKTFYPNPINLLVFILSIGIDGILVVVLADLFSANYDTTSRLLVAVSSYLLLKRLFMVGISLVVGLISLRLSPIQLFNSSVALCLLSLILIAGGYLVLGVTMAFVFNAIVVTFSPLMGVSRCSDSTLQVISGISTWWDMGASIGAFLGILLIEQFGREKLFLIIAGLIATMFINFIVQNGKRNRAVL